MFWRCHHWNKCPLRVSWCFWAASRCSSRCWAPWPGKAQFGVLMRGFNFLGRDLSIFGLGMGRREGKTGGKGEAASAGSESLRWLLRRHSLARNHLGNSMGNSIFQACPAGPSALQDIRVTPSSRNFSQEKGGTKAPSSLSNIHTKGQAGPTWCSRARERWRWKI